MKKINKEIVNATLSKKHLRKGTLMFKVHSLLMDLWDLSFQKITQSLIPKRSLYTK